MFSSLIYFSFKTFFVLLLFTFVSCIDESSVDDGKSREASHIDLTTTFDGSDDGEAAGSIADNKVKEFRVLVFEPGGACKYNVYVADIAGNIPLRLSLTQGIYDFVFIANEGEDSSLSTQLAGFDSGKTLADLAALSFASSAFDMGKNIPMSHIQRNVEIADHQYKIEETEYQNTVPWKVPLKRLGVRVDLHIKTTSLIKQQNFTGLEIFNIPKTVPVLEKDVIGNMLYNGGAGNYEANARTFDVSSADNGGFQKVGDAYEWILTNIILPSSIFVPDSREEAIKFKANYTDRDSEIAVLEAEGSTQHQAPRNTTFIVDATISASSLELRVKVEDWDEFLYHSSLVPNVDLNVSNISLNVTEYNRARVLFTSNQPNVYLEELTTTGESVDDLFYGLVGDNAYNFTYQYDEATGRGNGYFDLTVDRFKELLENKQYKRVDITLNASGVKRTISVGITIAPAVFAKYQYIGAFWRNNQTGERLITIENTSSTGSWSAEVVDGKEWIVLDEKKSLDPDLFTANPADAEHYQVDSERIYISGSGHIFFRIGLRGVNPNTEPRYGLIRVNKNGVWSNVYVRQGEEPDYLMRPEDTNGSGGWLGASGADVPRPLAGKFSPYNLTAQAYLDGTNTGGSAMTSFPQLSYKGGTFTQYPTQAGALFAFASGTYTRIAAHPFNALYINTWEQTYETSTWSTLKSTHETCPPGYRRMRDGNEGSYNTGGSYINVSELKQSLWHNPKNSTMTNVTDNSAFGYYADGFFDRRLIEDAGGLNTHLDDAAVAASTNGIAYAGRLFYNPYNNASLFFPAAGQRISITTSDPKRRGALMYAGYRGYYWTSSSSSTSGHFLSICYDSHNESAGVGHLTRASGYSIRCVKESD